MWKNVNGRLVHITDTTRVKFRTNISKEILEELKLIAAQHNTHVNYLLEEGLSNLILKGKIDYDKNARPIDRIQYKTTYNNELLEEVKKLAKENNLFINDVIEYSVSFIKLDNIKNKQYKHRIE